jgi:rubrerythrin
MKMNTVDQILDFAIEKEQDAHDFYMDLAGKMDRPYMKKVFDGFAREELGHKKKLEGIKAGKMMATSEKKVLDLKIGDNLVNIELAPNLGFQDALIVAMKAEKAAFKLYTDLAATTDNAELQTILLGLAQEEAKHKLRFEIEYDDYALKEN